MTISNASPNAASTMKFGTALECRAFFWFNYSVKVILANPRGFCAGVNMAVDGLQRALELYGTPLYLFHEIVHNHHVVRAFREQGVTFVEDLAEVPEGAIVLFSAHGVSPEVRQLARTRNLKAIDATCPLVTKVHNEAVRFANAGYQIVLVGHEGHDEVIGTMGEAPQSIVLVEDIEDVQALPFTTETKLAYLTQTTLSVDDAQRIIDALKKRFPQIVGPPREDICYATQNRQEAVRILAQEADLVLVLGSQNSSNSQRLAEIGRTMGKGAYLIDDVSEVKSEWFTGVETVLVTAGASAPEWVVQDLVSHLKKNYNAEVELRSIKQENVRFALPKELRPARTAAPSTATATPTL
jgi:4-hydroxy-3-methylbut-2-en-1-yl diphosphate reductase